MQSINPSKPRLSIILIHLNNQEYIEYNEYLINANKSGLDRYPEGLIGRGSGYDVVSLIDVFPEFIESLGFDKEVIGYTQTLPKKYLDDRAAINPKDEGASIKLLGLNNRYAAKSKLKEVKKTSKIDSLVLDCAAKIKAILKVNNIKTLKSNQKLQNIQLNGKYLSLTVQRLMNEKKEFPFEIGNGIGSVGSLTSYYSEDITTALDNVAIFVADDRIIDGHQEANHKLISVFPN
jgi:hypothetical protein